MEKLFTFQFTFVNPETNARDETQFCASSQMEAISLFTTWCQLDMHFKTVPTPSNIEVVYNQSDADEYGNNYGKPEEYKD